MLGYEKTLGWGGFQKKNFGETQGMNGQSHLLCTALNKKSKILGEKSSLCSFMFQQCCFSKKKNGDCFRIPPTKKFPQLNKKCVVRGSSISANLKFSKKRKKMVTGASCKKLFKRA